MTLNRTPHTRVRTRSPRRPARTCPVRECGRPLQHHHDVMCGAHWGSVSAPTREAVRRAFAATREDARRDAVLEAERVSRRKQHERAGTKPVAIGWRPHRSGESVLLIEGENRLAALVGPGSNVFIAVVEPRLWRSLFWSQDPRENAVQVDSILALDGWGRRPWGMAGARTAPILTEEFVRAPADREVADGT